MLDVNGNGRPEIFFGWIDDPDDINQGYYRVGWDLDANGNVASWWADLPRRSQAPLARRIPAWA